MSEFALFLNDFFASFDGAMFELCAAIHQSAGAVFDPFFKFITVFGDHGFFFIFLSVALTLIPKTRRVGLAMLLAIAVGALITNLCLKELVARERPYVTLDWVREIWISVGHGGESDLSFPSGHTTVAFASCTAFFLVCNKKYSWVALIFATLIGFSRIYLAVHYTTDVLGGVLVGTFAALAVFIPARYLSDLADKGQKMLVARLKKRN